MGLIEETQPLLGKIVIVGGKKFNQYLAAISGMGKVEA
jgi:hypothetical protein